MHEFAEQLYPVATDTDAVDAYRAQRSAFLQAVDERAVEFGADIDLATFAGVYRGVVDDVLMADGFVHLKKQQYAREYGNSINYFAHMARGALDWDYLGEGAYVSRLDSSDAQTTYQDVLNNVVSVVAEHPLAESVGYEHRAEQWTPDWRIHIGGSFLDTILDDALTSKQIYAFERDRYRANRANYTKLRTGRQGGDHRTFVEFSPTPEITPEATKRGYLGNSCVFFYEYNPDTREEIVTQRWIKTNWQTFSTILTQLGVETIADDVAIMNESAFFDDGHIAYIHTWIDNQQGRIEEHAEDIMHYVATTLRADIDRRARGILRDGAPAFLDGADMKPYLEQLMQVLTYAQLRLHKEVADITGLHTAPQYTQRFMQAVDFDLIDRNHAAFAAFMASYADQLELVGCGTSVRLGNQNAQDATGVSFFGPIASMGELLFAGSDEYGSLVFECPHCAQANVRDRGKLLAACQHCGKDVACDPAAAGDPVPQSAADGASDEHTESSKPKTAVYPVRPSSQTDSTDADQPPMDSKDLDDKYDDEYEEQQAA